MDQRSSAEEQYQQGLHYAQQVEGDRRENLQHAVAYYEAALQYFTEAEFPEQWQQLQQALATAYSELVRERLKQTPERITAPRFIRRQRLTMQQRLFLVVIAIVILAIPTTALATTYLNGNTPPCISDTLNIDGSAVLQPFVEAAAAEYMQHCPGASITVGGGASKTGLADVEQGHDSITGVNPLKDPRHISGKDVSIQIGDSDIFASPLQRDLVDHQVAIGVFALILHSDVTGLHNLSTAQIQGIYTGVYHSWSQICDHGQCGPDLPIVPISRTLNSGTRFTFEKYILNGVATVPGIGLNRTTAAGNAVQEVEGNPGSIGYAPLYMVQQVHDVTLLSIDDQTPRSLALIQHDTYHFWNIEHMYTRGNGSPLARAFINYVSGNAAGHLLSQFALVPLSAIPQAVRNRHILHP